MTARARRDLAEHSFIKMAETALGYMKSHALLTREKADARCLAFELCSISFMITIRPMIMLTGLQITKKRGSTQTIRHAFLLTAIASVRCHHLLNPVKGKQERKGTTYLGKSPFSPTACVCIDACNF